MQMPQHAMMTISAGIYRGASSGRKVNGPARVSRCILKIFGAHLPTMLPAQYPIRYKAATVVFLV